MTSTGSHHANNIYHDIKFILTSDHVLMFSTALLTDTTNLGYGFDPAPAPAQQQPSGMGMFPMWMLFYMMN